MARWFLFCCLLTLMENFALTSTPMLAKQQLMLVKLLLQQPIELQTSDSNASNECFNLYLPQLQAAGDEWSSNYADCYNSADNKRYNFIAQLKSDQININESSNDICNYIKNCQSMNDALDYFKCFSSLSQNVVTTIYIISNNATDDAMLLTQQLDGINNDLYICTNNTQRAYVEQTADIFDALENCLIYGLDESLSTTDNIDKLNEMITQSKAESTTVLGDNTDSTLTANNEITSNDETTYFEHTTIPIMSV